MPRPRRSAALVVLALAVSGGACSSSSDGRSAGTTSSSGGSTTSTAAPTTSTSVDVDALVPPGRPADAAALVSLVAPAERTLHDAAATEADVAAAALAQQVAYRTLGDHPEWDAEVRAGLPAERHAELDRHVRARRELRALGGAPRTTLPAWRIVAPVPLDELQRDYVEAGAAFGIPWTYLAAINLVETGMGRIRGTSEAGAQGPMQFLPATWAAYGAGGDVNDSHDAIFGAARLLAADGGTTDIEKAVFQYNHSDHYVAAVSEYAALMAADPLALRALHRWGVYYRTVNGDVPLPVGYAQTTPIPAP